MTDSQLKALGMTRESNLNWHGMGENTVNGAIMNVIADDFDEFLKKQIMNDGHLEEEVDEFLNALNSGNGGEIN